MPLEEENAALRKKVRGGGGPADGLSDDARVVRDGRQVHQHVEVATWNNRPSLHSRIHS
jgi:hypothetical protein